MSSSHDSPTRAWTRRALAVALPAGVAVAAVCALVRPATVGWALAGWALMSAAGVAQGRWLVRAHGRPGSAFLVAVAGGMGLRVLLAAAGAAAVFLVDRAGALPYVAGLGVGYVALFAAEAAWFLERSASRPTAPGPLRRTTR